MLRLDLTQRRYIMLIFRFIIVSLVSARIGLHVLMLKELISFLLSSAAALNSRSVWNALFLAPVALSPLSSDWPAHPRLNQHLSPCHESALMCFQFLFYCEYRHRLCKCVTGWYNVILRSHRIKGETTHEHFRHSSPCSVGERRSHWHFVLCVCLCVCVCVCVCVHV